MVLFGVAKSVSERRPSHTQVGRSISSTIDTLLNQHPVDFDTGSSDLFLPGPNCKTNCDGHTVYDPSKSSTAVPLTTPFSLQYGDGSAVNGTEYADTVSIAGLTVCSISFHDSTD